MMFKIAIFLLVAISLSLIPESGGADTCTAKKYNLDPLTLIGTWNIQKLGKTKMGRPEVVKMLVKVILRYHILAVEEIQDSSNTSAWLLLDEVNAAFTEQKKANPDNYPEDAVYNMEISERIGETGSSYREQVAYYYRTDFAEVTDSFTYDDDVDMIFKRVPYIALFKLKHSRTDSIAMVAIHTSPDNAVPAISKLADVYYWVKNKTEENQVMILGDFNSGCTYLKDDDWENIKLWTDKTFYWAIDNHADTTTKGTGCAYDRIVLAGQSLTRTAYAGSAKAFFFDELYDLALNFTELVSDHYPVEIVLRGSSSSFAKTFLPTVGFSINVDSRNALNESVSDMVDGMLAMNETELAQIWNPSVINDTAITVIKMKSSDKPMENIDAVLTSLNEQFECVFNDGVMKVLKYKIENGVLADPALYGDHKDIEELSITLLCHGTDTVAWSCKISIDAPTNVS